MALKPTQLACLFCIPEMTSKSNMSINRKKADISKYLSMTFHLYVSQEAIQSSYFLTVVKRLSVQLVNQTNKFLREMLRYPFSLDAC